MSKTIITGRVRFSYVNVFEPTGMGDDSTKKYNMAILIDKTDEMTLGRVKAAIDEVLKSKEAEWAKNGKMPKVELPLKDGDEDKPDLQEYSGMMFVNAKSIRKPGIVNKNNEPIMSQEEIYSGCYGRVQLTFYPYDFKGKKGIAVGLENIQTYNEGEPFGGVGMSAEEAFASADEAFGGAGTTEAF